MLHLKQAVRPAISHLTLQPGWFHGLEFCLTYIVFFSKNRKMADNVTLTYSDSPGLARTVRIALCLAGIKVLRDRSKICIMNTLDFVI